MKIVTDGIAILELPVKIMENLETVFHPIFIMGRSRCYSCRHWISRLCYP